MSSLTTQQKAAQDRRAKRSVAVAEGTPADAPAPVAFTAMLGHGEPVRIGGRDYEIAAVPVARLGQAGRLIAGCPQVLVMHALAAQESGAFDSAATGALMQRVAAMRAAPALDKTDEGSTASASAESLMNAEAITFALATLAANISDEESEAMVDLAVLTLSRRCPGVDREQIAAEMDLEVFLRILAAVLDSSPTLCRSF